VKVFWAWQSDTHGKTGRHFVKSVLEAAIDRLNKHRDIEEPDQGFQSAYQLDHDRKGLRGSPDLAAAILLKIATSDVIVADVTPVGQGVPYKADDGSDHPGKRIMNPNVAIELGYALHSLKTDRILMVLNTHYGTREHVPFDLAAKAGPILYKLAPDASGEEIKAEAKRLTEWFVEALKPYDDKPESAPKAKFTRREAVSSAAYFAPEEEILGQNINSDLKEKYRIEHGPAFYLRLLPHAELRRPLHVDTLSRHVGALGPFAMHSQGLGRRNAYGSICFDPLDEERIDSLSQAFRNGELWGINRRMLRHGESQTPKLISEQYLEDVLLYHLSLYVRFLKDIVQAPPPYQVEAGIVGVPGWKLQPIRASSGEMDKGDIICKAR
jgi:hypothetical protein